MTSAGVPKKQTKGRKPADLWHWQGRRGQKFPKLCGRHIWKPRYASSIFIPCLSGIRLVFLWHQPAINVDSTRLALLSFLPLEAISCMHSVADPSFIPRQRHPQPCVWQNLGKYSDWPVSSSLANRDNWPEFMFIKTRDQSPTYRGIQNYSCLFENSRPSAARQLGQPIHSQSANFVKLKLNSHNLAEIILHHSVSVGPVSYLYKRKLCSG